MACVRSDTAHSDNGIVRELKKRPPATMRACVVCAQTRGSRWSGRVHVERDSWAGTARRFPNSHSCNHHGRGAQVRRCWSVSYAFVAARVRVSIVPASSRHGVEASIHHIILCARYKPRTPPKALKSIGRYEVCLKAACCIGEAALNVWYDRKRNDIIANERSRCVLHTRTCRTACGLGCSSTLATPW